MLGILTIPHSNTPCERVFSCVRKNKTDQRASLSAQTLEALLLVKGRQGSEFTDEELRKYKKATAAAVKPS